MRISTAIARVFIFFYAISFIFSGTSLSYSQEPRDPFSPLISKNGLILIPREIDISGLNLRGIIYSPKGSLAIINEEVLRTGDTIGDYSILEINEREVILRKGDGNEGFTLRLEEE
jgi:hypothetical protein